MRAHVVHHNDVLKRAEDTFGDIYFVGLGVFQSIIAAKLFEVAFASIDWWQRNGFIGTTDFLTASSTCIRFLTSGLLIACVMFSYWWWVVLVRRQPRMRDIFRPFSMGFCQFGQIIFIQNPSMWCLWVGLFCIMAFFALWNSGARLMENQFLGVQNNVLPIDVPFFRRWMFNPMAGCAVVGSILGISAFAVAHLKPRIFVGHEPGLRLLAAGTLGGCVLVYALMERRFLNELQKTLPFESPP